MRATMTPCQSLLKSQFFSSLVGGKPALTQTSHSKIKMSDGSASIVAAIYLLAKDPRVLIFIIHLSREPTLGLNTFDLALPITGTYRKLLT